MSVPNIIYNVNVKSKFELFLNEDFCEAEPEELVKKINEDKKKKEQAQKEAKKQKQVESKKKPTTTDTSAAKPAAEKSETADKAPRFKNSANRLPVKGIKPQNEKPNSATKVDSGVDDDGREDESRNVKNKKISNNPPRKGRGREFDRHSGSDKTGIKPIEKREGSGAHNWGSIKDVVDVAEETTEKVQKDESAEKESENDTDKDKDNATEKKEPEKTTMTLSEWRARNKESTAIISSTSSCRAANNGESVFSGMNAYQKRVKHSSESDNDLNVPDDDGELKGRRQIKVNIEFTGRSNRRAGRGGYNNSRFGNTNRGVDDTRSAGAVATGNKDMLINLDENEFPVLS